LKKNSKDIDNVKNVEFEKNRNSKYIPKFHNVKKKLPHVNGMAYIKKIVVYNIKP